MNSENAPAGNQHWRASASAGADAYASSALSDGIVGACPTTSSPDTSSSISPIRCSTVSVPPW